MVWRRHVSTQRSHCGHIDYSKSERLAVENWISTHLPLPFLVRVLISPMLCNVLAPRSPHFTFRSRGKHLYKFLQREESTRLAYYSGPRLAYKPALSEIHICCVLVSPRRAVLIKRTCSADQSSSFSAFRHTLPRLGRQMQPSGIRKRLLEKTCLWWSETSGHCYHSLRVSAHGIKDELLG